MQKTKKEIVGTIISRKPSAEAAANVMKKDRQWYAVYTKSRCEKKMLDFLTDVKIEAYVPIRKEMHKWSDRKKLVEMPMIHSYCFVKLDWESERNKVFVAPGFVNFVCHDRVGVVIPQSEIDLMKKTVDSMLAIEVENRLLRTGKKVRILTGPMTGTVGKVEALTSKRVNIVLEAVGVTMIVDLNDDVQFETVYESDEEEN